MIDAAVRTLLASDSMLTAMLGTYSGQPAIFVQGRVPIGFDRGTRPYVLLREAEAGEPLDGDRDFFTVPVDVFVEMANHGDAASCEAAAWRVRTVLDGAHVAPAGFSAAGMMIESGPTPSDPDDLTFGRTLRAMVGLVQA